MVDEGSLKVTQVASAYVSQDMVDWQFYDDERVCLLTKGAAAPSDAHLARIECGKLRWRPLAAVSRSRCLDAASPAVLAAASAADVAMDFSGDVEWRQLPNSMPVCLAVNGRRGLASVMIKGGHFKSFLVQTCTRGEAVGRNVRVQSHGFESSLILR